MPPTKTANSSTPKKATRKPAAPKGPVETRLAELRKQAKTDPKGAQDATWAWIKKLGAGGKDAELEQLFGKGKVPAPIDGQTEGILVRFVSPPVVGPVLNRITSAWMPWVGKQFSSEDSKGENTLTNSAVLPSKLLWPLYKMRKAAGTHTAFDFETKVEPGRIKPAPKVLVIDYAPIEENPDLLIRQIRDELVELVPNTHLGRMLFKLPGRRGYANLAYFALKQPAA